MGIEFTQWASDILARTHAASTRFNPDARIRLQRGSGGDIEFALTDEADPTDEVIEADGFTLLVEQGLAGIVDVVEPHDQLILRPPGSTERSIAHDPRPA